MASEGEERMRRKKICFLLHSSFLLLLLSHLLVVVEGGGDKGASVEGTQTVEEGRVEVGTWTLGGAREVEMEGTQEKSREAREEELWKETRKESQGERKEDNEEVNEKKQEVNEKGREAAWEENQEVRKTKEAYEKHQEVEEERKVARKKKKEVAAAKKDQELNQEEEETRRKVAEKDFPPLCMNLTEDNNNDHPAPSYLQTLQGSYTMTVEMTYRMRNKTYYVEEAREMAMVDGMDVNTGGVHITTNGSKVSYYYYPGSEHQMVEEQDGQCRLTGTDVPPFNEWGWWDPDPSHGDYLYGPSALFRRAYFTNKLYLGVDKDVDGVVCEYWSTCEANQSIVVYYYFSEPPWVMPDGSLLPEGEGRVLVRMEVLYMDLWERVQYNILAFVPFLPNPSLVQTPRGEGCEEAVSVVPNAPRPHPASHFSFYQEVVRHPSIDGSDLGVSSQHVSRVKVTYSYPLNLVRYDYSPPLTDDSSYTVLTKLRVVHDFNTGVQYVVDENVGNCTRSRIPDNFFDDYVDGLFSTGGNMVTPDQLFHLDDTFSLVGPHSTRYDSSTLDAAQPKALLWTSTRSDLPDPDTGGLQTFPKAVLEYYFTKMDEVTVGGLEVVDVPLRADVFVYNNTDPTQVVAMRTINIYDFSVVRQYLEDEWYVGECVLDQNEERGRDSSVFLIVFPANRRQEAAVSEQVDVFKNQLFSLLLTAAQISPTRILTMDVSIDISAPSRKITRIPARDKATKEGYGATNSILATVKVLERPPYFLSYVEPKDDPNPVPGTKEELVRGIVEAERCASVCSTYTAFNCKAFHQCGDSCYLSRLEGTDGDPDYSVEGCRLWVLAVSNTSILDPPTDQAYQLLLNAINTHMFTITLVYEDDVVMISATEALHYDQMDPLAPLRAEFSLTATATTLVYPDTSLFQVASLEQCFISCVSWKEYRCVTVSYRQEQSRGDMGGIKEVVQGGSCSLSATHYGDLNSTALTPDSQADVYSRLYLTEYEPVFGGVALNTSGPVYSNVTSADDCAKSCTTETSIKCLSFEWCFSDNVCHLHAEHFLDVVDGGNYLTGTSCIHFSSKMDLSFSQYAAQGWSDEEHTLVATDSSSSACAKLCLEDIEEVCESFDTCSLCEEEDAEVCGKDNVGLSNLCFLSNRHIGQPGAKLISAQHCRHYSREVFGDLDYPAWVASVTFQPYTPADMAWLGVAMVVLGALVTMAFLFLLVYTRPPSISTTISTSSSASTNHDQPMTYIELKSALGESES